MYSLVKEILAKATPLHNSNHDLKVVAIDGRGNTSWIFCILVPPRYKNLIGKMFIFELQIFCLFVVSQLVN